MLQHFVAPFLVAELLRLRKFLLGESGQADEIKIARAGGGNRKFIRVHQELMKPYERRAAIGALDEETALPVLAKIYAKAIGRMKSIPQICNSSSPPGCM